VKRQRQTFLHSVATHLCGIALLTRVVVNGLQLILSPPPLPRNVKTGGVTWIDGERRMDEMTK